MIGKNVKYFLTTDDAFLLSRKYERDFGITVEEFKAGDECAAIVVGQKDDSVNIMVIPNGPQTLMHWKVNVKLGIKPGNCIRV